MREYKGHQIERTHNLFDDLVSKYYDYEDLCAYGAGGQKHAIVVDGKTIGVYNHGTEKLRLPDGLFYDLRTGLLETKEGPMLCSFSIVLQRAGLL